MTSNSVCSTTLLLCHIGHLSSVWFGSFTCAMVLTAFLVEICVTLGQELFIACIVQGAFCSSVVTPGPAISFCHKVLCLVIVVAS